MNAQAVILASAPWIIAALLALSLAVTLIRYFALALGLERASGWLRALNPRGRHERAARAGALSVLRTVLIAFALSRALIWLIGLIGAVYTVDVIPGGWPDTVTYADIWRAALDEYLPGMRSLASQWDASHYLGIAENGYVTEGDARFHIVFYPMYPYAVRALSYVLGDTLISAVALSNACLVLSGVIMYKLTEISYGSRAGARAAWLLMFSPAGVFFSVAYTESLFLALTLLAVYLARRRRFALAVMCGALSAFTRSPGLIVAVPIFFEMLRADARAGRVSEGGAVSAKLALKRAALRVLECLPILSGLAAYICVNYIVTGDAFRFLTYQSEHWYQRMGSVTGTVRYTLSNAMNFSSDSAFYGIWLPQSVFLILIAAVIAVSARRAHPRDGAYSIVYYAFTVCPTWLLSGPRYLCAMYSLYPALARFCRNKYARACVYTLNALLFIYLSFMYMTKRWLL